MPELRKARAPTPPRSSWIVWLFLALTILLVLGVGVGVGFIVHTALLGMSQSIEVTADATVGLAAVGAISILTNLWLAWSSNRMARAAEESADWAKSQVVQLRRQMSLLGRDVALAETVHDRAKVVAFPLLVSKVAMTVGNTLPTASLNYVSGSEPARDLRMWIRYADQYFSGHEDLMVPTSGEKTVALHVDDLESVSASVAQVPFANRFLKPLEPEVKAISLVTWVGLDAPGYYAAQLEGGAWDSEGPQRVPQGADSGRTLGVDKGEADIALMDTDFIFETKVLESPSVGGRVADYRETRAPAAREDGDPGQLHHEEEGIVPLKQD